MINSTMNGTACTPGLRRGTGPKIPGRAGLRDVHELPRLTLCDRNLEAHRHAHRAHQRAVVDAASRCGQGTARPGSVERRTAHEATVIARGAVFPHVRSAAGGIGAERERAVVLHCARDGALLGVTALRGLDRKAAREI